MLSKSGPFFLLGALTIVLFKFAPVYWPLLLTALVGYALIKAWNKTGFFLSLAVLATAIFMNLSTDLFWALFSASIAISWLVILLDQQETAAFMQSKDETAAALAKDCAHLQKQLEKANAETQRYSQFKHSQEAEKENLKMQCEALTHENAALKHAFDALKNAQLPVPNIVPQEEESPEEKIELEQIQRQYALLREQFDEKSEALDQSRKELFQTENRLLVLQKEQEEQALESSEENVSLAADLKVLEEEVRDFENQIANLQELISLLVIPKKRAVRSRKTDDEDSEELPQLIQDKIERTSRKVKSE